MAEYASRRFGLDVVAASFEDWGSARAFDLVTMLQVLPHFVDPRGAMVKAARLLRPGGHVVIETWNRASWTARVLGRHWHEYSPPSVLHWFSVGGLTRLARDVGLEPVGRGRPAKWILAGHAKSVLRAKAEGSVVNRVLLGAARWVPDRVAVPYPAEDLFWMLLRKVR
jgi:SAM-dependent methyltransferase